MRVESVCSLRRWRGNRNTLSTRGSLMMIIAFITSKNSLALLGGGSICSNLAGSKVSVLRLQPFLFFVKTKTALHPDFISPPSIYVLRTHICIYVSSTVDYLDSSGSPGVSSRPHRLTSDYPPCNVCVCARIHVNTHTHAPTPRQK